MIVVSPYQSDEWLVQDVNEDGPLLSGGPGPIGGAPHESLVNPRRIGFAREPFYIPVYWENNAT